MGKVRIYTKTGDKGETSLIGGKRVPKDSQRVTAYGTLDELNSALGLTSSFIKDKRVSSIIRKIQTELFNIGAELANPHKLGNNTNDYYRLEQYKVKGLENIIDQFDLKLKPINYFLLPGGSKAGSILHLARSISRRAERDLVALSKQEKINPNILAYLNRLSDLLFVLARYENSKANIKDIPWKKD